VDRRRPTTRRAFALGAALVIFSSCGTAVQRDERSAGTATAPGPCGDVVAPTSTSSTIPPVTTTRDPFLWPFASNSPWNTPLGASAQLGGPADARTAAMRQRTGAWVNAGRYSQPVFQASPNDPEATVVATNGPTGERTATLRLPAGAVPALGDDAHLNIVDPTKHWVDEMWQTTGTPPTLRASYRVRNDLYGSGVGAGGTRAYGGSAIGGLIRRWELDAGNIGHALALALTSSQLAPGPVWPATGQDGDAATTYRGTAPMGTLLALPRPVDPTRLRLSREGTVLARALCQFGAYVVDRSESDTLYAEPALEGTTVLRHLRQDIVKLRPLLRPVVNSNSTQVGGLGPRLAPDAPALP